ncbi:MAG: contractile injection system tape measure protein [Leadbetterella sp.]
MQNHIVDNICLELEVPTQDLAFELKHQVSSYLQELLINNLENACNKACGENEIIRIQSLELDLGETSFENFEAHFKQRINETLDKELKKYASNRIPREELTTFSSDSDFQKAFYSKGGTNLEKLSHFLQTGQLIWWGRGEATDWTKLILDVYKQNSVELKALLNEAFQSKNFIDRIVYQFDNTIFIDIISTLYEAKEEIELVSSLLFKCREITRFLSGQESQITLAVVARIVGSKKAKTKENIVHLLMESISHYLDDNKTNQIKEAYFKDEISWQNSEFVKELEQDFSTIAEEIEGDKIYVDHAGIMLIASWLPQLFEQLGYIEKGLFKDNQTVYRAIYLVHFLATGEKSTEEHSLSLEKLLCGIPIQESIPRDISLSEYELSQANELLDAAVAHWSVLKTVDGLRDGFFIREGILYDRDGHWELRIEQKSHDIVFEHRSPNWTLSHDFIAEKIYPGATIVHRSSSKSLFYIHFSWMTKPIEILW